MAAMAAALASIKSANLCMTCARSAAGIADHAAKPSTAAASAIAAVSLSPRAMSANFHDQSSGVLTSKVRADGTRTPPMKCCGDTEMPSMSMRLSAAFMR